MLCKSSCRESPIGDSNFLLASPFDGASERSSLSYGRLLSRRDGVERVPEIMRRHFGCVSVVVYPAVVDTLPSLVEDEGLRCAYSGERSGEGLILIPDVGKVEPSLLRSFDHVLVTVFRIVLVAVRIHGDEADTSIPVVALDGDHAILVSLHVRAMIA